MDVGTHGLTCLGPEEYAGVALYMQCTAEHIDELLTEQQATFDLLNQRDTIILIPSVAVVTAASEADVYDSVQFDNSDFLSMNAAFPHPVLGTNAISIAIGSAIGVVPVVPYRRGFYEVGIYAEGTASVPSVNNISQAIVEVWDTDGVTLISRATGDNFWDLEDSAGVVRINGKYTFELTGTNGINVTTRLNRGGGGTITWATAGSFWVRYLGPNQQVETV